MSREWITLNEAPAVPKPVIPEVPASLSEPVKVRIWKVKRK